MFRKVNNKILLAVFAILAVIAVIVLIREQKKGERTFRSELFSIDSAAVTSVTIYPKGKATGELRLEKTGTGWEVASGQKRYPADSGSVHNLLQSLAHVMPERIAGTDRSSWAEFEITDSLSTHVVVEEGKKITADFRTGKISFSQRSKTQSYGNRNMDVKSRIRVAGDDRVYVVDGFLSMMFADSPSRYRNRVLFRAEKEQVTRLTFTYPGDSSFILFWQGGRWMAGDRPADSLSTAKYLNSIASTMGSEFAEDDAVLPAFDFILKIEGNNMPSVDVYGAASAETKKYYLKSNMNPSSVFVSSTPDLFNRIFAGKRKFLGNQ
jgi:hypothetical protein